MIITRLYQATLKCKSEQASALLYKINKGIVNVLYPIIGKCGYGIDEDSDIIISLTSYPGRINTIYLTIMTLLNQTIKPRMIVLWLAKEQFPNEMEDLPKNLVGLVEKGLTIRFCDNLYPHKKYYYTMLENPDAYIVTVDDDTFYPENMLEKLLEVSRLYPGVICCTWGQSFLNSDEKVGESQELWKEELTYGEPSYNLIPTGVGGVLYPPKSLHLEVFNKDVFMAICPKEDDLWLKAMALLNHTKAVRIRQKGKIYFSILKTQSSGLYFDNVYQSKNKEAWIHIMNAYPECCDVLKRTF